MKTSVLEFKLFEDVFCFNTQDVEYVFELEEYEKLKGFHSSVIGITKYNNDVMLLIDTAKLYSDRFLDLETQKSVVVIRDEENKHYGMIVDEITKLEEIERVKLSVDLSTEDMVINHYKDKEADEIVTEIYPHPLFKKYDIPAMAVLAEKQLKESAVKSIQNTQSYLLFTINEQNYTFQTKKK
jgi:chemotaxis signal transduction protein